MSTLRSVSSPPGLTHREDLPRPQIDRLVQSVTTRLAAQPGVTRAGLIAFGPGDFACFLAISGEMGTVTDGARPMRRAQARYLRHRARLGVWIERWLPELVGAAFGDPPIDDGLTAAVYVPLRTETSVPGLLVAATDRPDGAELLERRLSAFAEFGLAASGSVAEALAQRGRSNSIRADISRAIARRAFRPVFQPIVRFDDGATVAMEVLTRFGDGAAPQRRFGEADSVGLGLDLEVATLEAAVAAAAALDDGLRLNVNVSPDMILRCRELDRIVGPWAHRITLELTEQQRVDDYRALRRAVGRLPHGVRWAIDDAGAGFASLRHIIELRPQEVKLDRVIVTRVDRDPIRQAVVAGLSHFAATAGCDLIAEGVETVAERDALRSLGVGLGQGFLFGGPAALPETT